MLSYPNGTLCAFSLLLVGLIHLGRDAWWGSIGHLGIACMIGVVMWEALSKREYERVRKQHPEETRLNWILNWMFWGVAIPLAIWGLFGLPALVRTLGR